jgi:S-adenosylmethionine synthetase
MFGYACDETPNYMPSAIYYSHEILKALQTARENGADWLGPDSKSQVTFNYDSVGKPIDIKTVVCSTQHSHELSIEEVRDRVMDIILPVVKDKVDLLHTEWLINPTGRFVIGGPDGDTGLTGRKIIVDTYGGAAPHGGGAFSGKDPTKVDRSAAYAARYIAKNIVASNIAERCLIQLAYAIGVSKPLSIYVDLFDNDLEKNKFVTEKISENFDLSPRGIREMLGLNKPIYEKTAAYGHFGRVPEANGSFSWEKTNKKDIFSK